MSDYYSPNETQLRSAVKGEDRYRFYERRNGWLMLVVYALLAILFFGSFAFVFFFGLTGKD
jgi:hypothetical protein